MTSSNSDRQMATKENEHYWRLYLYLNEGVSFLSRSIIVRKLDGQDLSSLMGINEGQLKKNDNLDLMDLEVLFPVDGKTNMDKWNANMYLCVILALFRASLKPKERTKLGTVQHVLEDLYKRQDYTKIDHLTYEEHVENLEEAFLAFSFNEDSMMKIVEIKKVYLDEPLDINSLKTDIDKMIYHSGTKQKFLKFLESISSTNTIRSFDDESGKFGKTIDFDENQKSIGEETEYNKCTEDAAVTNSTTDSVLETGSDEIGVCVSYGDAENSSDGFGTGDLLAEETELHEEIVNEAKKHQIDEVQDFETFAEEKIEKWKQEPVNIAVIGRSGVGKSRLINAIRGCTYKDDPLYATVGTTETTSEVRSYSHPNNPLLKFWDLPGIGTNAFPRQHFIKKKGINFYSYDLYLIVSADRFMEDEEYFAEEIEKSGKAFLFVRTKADVNEEEFIDFPLELQKMRDECVKKLHSRKIKATDVYLISSKVVDHKQLDFDKLINRLICSLPELKKEVMLNSLKVITKDLIRDKRAQLENTAKIASALSAVAGVMPLQGLSIFVDCEIISYVLDEYRRALCITEMDLDDLAKQTGVSVNTLKEKYKLKSYSSLRDPNSFLPLIMKIAESDKSRPLIGAVCGAGISFYTTYTFLTSSLEIMVKDSEKRLDILLETTGKKLLQGNFLNETSKRE